MQVEELAMHRETDSENSHTHRHPHQHIRTHVYTHTCFVACSHHTTPTMVELPTYQASGCV